MSGVIGNILTGVAVLWCTASSSKVSQGCIKFLIPGGGWEFIKYVGEEYQVVKRGKEYYYCGEEYNIEKRERGRNIIFPTILRLLGRISSREENQDLKEWGWGRI